MDTALLVVRLFLALVFVIAGFGKVADKAGTRQAMLGFGLPSIFTTPFSILLPLVELAISIGLIFERTAWEAALGATGLLLIFLIAIIINLLIGRQPDCHCFGQIHSEPIGWSTLMRNGVFILLAGFLVWKGPASIGPSAMAWITTLTGFQLMSFIFATLLLGLLVAEGWFLIHLLRQNGRLLLRIETLESKILLGSSSSSTNFPSNSNLTTKQTGLPVGVEAPPFSLRDLEGNSRTLDMLCANGKPVYLILIDPNCGPCIAFLPNLVRWQNDYENLLTIAIISRGTPEANRAKFGDHHLANFLLQQDHEISKAYQVAGTPSAVLILQDGTVGSSVAGGVEAIKGLISLLAKGLFQKVSTGTNGEERFWVKANDSVK